MKITLPADELQQLTSWLKNNSGLTAETLDSIPDIELYNRYHTEFGHNSYSKTTFTRALRLLNIARVSKRFASGHTKAYRPANLIPCPESHHCNTCNNTGFIKSR